TASLVVILNAAVGPQQVPLQIGDAVPMRLQVYRLPCMRREGVVLPLPNVSNCAAHRGSHSHRPGRRRSHGYGRERVIAGGRPIGANPDHVAASFGQYLAPDVTASLIVVLNAPIRPQ